jgi:hypothetical protein
MNEEQGRAAEADQEMGSDVERAAAILRDAGEHARHQLRHSDPILFTTRGLMFLLGYGVLWLSVRDQHPYQGPTPTALLTLSIIVAVAMAIGVILVGRAASGIGGTSTRQRSVFLVSAIAALAGLFTLEAALAHADASNAVLGVYGAAAPILLIGVISALGAAVALNWTAFALGLWLIAVGAGSAFAGPVAVWGVDALATSAGFLAIAALRLKERRGR